MVSRVKLRFARGLEVPFCDRDVALRQFREIAERGTRRPVVIYGPEGCGKTALLRQVALLLEEEGYRVVYVNPLENYFKNAVYCSKDVENLVIEAFRDLLSIYAGDLGRALAYLGLAAASVILRRFHKPMLAVLIDDVFQVIRDSAGISVASYVKSALNLIEYPPGDYEKIVVIIATSEDISREEIGRHRWAEMCAMWNFSREGFYELYSKVPGKKPSFDIVWRWTGGNPWLFAELYEHDWNVDIILDSLVQVKKLEIFIRQLDNENREILREAVQDIDYLWNNLNKCISLVKELVKLNLIVDALPSRKQYLWIDVPPPEKDPELGIGKHFAWQTPLHREAVKKILETL